MYNKTDDRKNLILFPLGTFGRDMIYALVTNFLLSFIMFTQNLNASQLASITLIMIGARVFDALNDIDNIRDCAAAIKKVGAHFEPAISYTRSPVHTLDSYIFNNPFEGWAFVATFGVVYFLYSIAYTMHDISYWGMIPSLSSDAGMRNKFTSRTTLIAGIGGTLANILIPMLTTGAFAIGGSAKIAYGRIALIVGLIAPLFLLFTIIGVREDRHYMNEKIPPVSFRKIISTVRNNDQLRWGCLYLLLQQIGNGLALSGIAATYIYFEFGYSGGLFSIYTTLGMLPTAFLMIFYPILSKKWGRRSLVKALSAIALAGYALSLIIGLALPSTNVKFIILTIGYMASNFGQYGLYLIAMISILNTVEYNEYKNGTRDEAIIASMRPFFTKLSSALTVLLATGSYILFGILEYTNSISDYENLATRGLIGEAEKLKGIESIIKSATSGEADALLIPMCVLPAILLIISSWLYLKKYKLDEKYYDDICASLGEGK